MAVKKFSHQTNNLETQVDSSLEKKQGNTIFYKGEGVFSLQPLMEEKENPKSAYSSKKILDKDILTLSFGDERNSDFFAVVPERIKRDLVQHPELLEELLEHASTIASKANKSLVVAPEIAAAFFQPVINFVSAGNNFFPMTYDKAKKVLDTIGSITIKPMDMSLTKYFHYAYVSGAKSLSEMLSSPFYAKHSNTIINDIYRNVLVPDGDNVNVDYSNLKKYCEKDNYFIIGGNHVTSISNNAYRTLFVINKDNELSVDLSKITLSNIPNNVKLSYYSMKGYYEGLKDNKIKFPKMGENISSNFYMNVEEEVSNGRYADIKNEKIHADKEELINMLRQGYETPISYNCNIKHTCFMRMIRDVIQETSKNNKGFKEAYLEIIEDNIKSEKQIYRDFKSSDEAYANEYIELVDRIASIIDLEKENQRPILRGLKDEDELKECIVKIRDDFENKKELNLES